MDNSYEYLKLCAARYVWNKPGKVYSKQEKEMITWRRWWEIKFNDDYTQYTMEQRRLKGKNK